MTRLRLSTLAAILAAGLLTATAAEADPPGFFDVFERAFPGVEFSRPVALKPDPSGSEWLFVVEQDGIIMTFINEDATEQTFEVLDLTDRVIGFDTDPEAGLLGLALHPQFGENGYIYIYYLTDITGSITARVSRFSTSGAPAVADPSSEEILIELNRVGLKHNGGDMHFSDDGYLFVSFGDAICCGDPGDHGQDRTNLFSTIIRIDVDNPSEGLLYGIPPDNPFVGNSEGWREEIWAYGLRNPWRFSIHPETGEIWVGDVGELMFEEINRIVPGGNYGWSVMEGPDCLEYPPGSGQGTNCEHVGILPAWYFDREEAIAITGGYVYQGDRRADLIGSYVFGDWGRKTIFVGTLNEAATEMLEVDVLVFQNGPHPSAFGVDAVGEFYVLDYFLGRLFRFIDNGTSTPPEPEPPVETRLLLDGPNPVRIETRVRIELADPALVELVVYDASGRRVATPLAAELLVSEVYSIELNVRGLAAGVYMVGLVVDGRLADHVPITVVR